MLSGRSWITNPAFPGSVYYWKQKPVNQAETVQVDQPATPHQRKVFLGAMLTLLAVELVTIAAIIYLKRRKRIAS